MSLTYKPDSGGPMDQVQASVKLAMKIILPFPKRCVCRLAKLHWEKRGSFDILDCFLKRKNQFKCFKHKSYFLSSYSKALKTRGFRTGRDKGRFGNLKLP